MSETSLPSLIAQIGDINVTSATVSAPTGTVALRGSQWTATDHWASERRTPRWAVICAVAGVCFTALLSLLLLLVRQETWKATVTVSVMQGQFFYTTRIVATTPEAVQEIYDRVNYVRSLALINPSTSAG